MFQCDGGQAAKFLATKGAGVAKTRPRAQIRAPVCACEGARVQIHDARHNYQGDFFAAEAEVEAAPPFARGTLSARSIAATTLGSSGVTLLP
jgi:hypothetical protein